MSAFTRVFNALWRHPGSAHHNRPRMQHPRFRFAYPGYLLGFVSLAKDEISFRIAVPIVYPRPSGVPIAALASCAKAGPRRTRATTTATMAPAAGPTT